MSDTVIKVDNLSKRYQLGSGDTGYKTFRETLVDSAKAPFLTLKSAFTAITNKTNPTNKTNSTNDPDLFWALRDVSFEVKQGEVVGIIGRNGAGKSTLLKILSKITEPTEGRIEIRGRIGSLLEVGTGFHPELSGHENVYLYGAILGMDRWEISRKFDEIIAFAELEKFIDTPVKRYSSGMYMRLAFAVAAHLEPEILLVDEVLAVGDAAFQKKCLGKMDDVSKEGRTVLFVSHNMNAITHLCTKCVLLNNGKIVKMGLTKDVVDNYIQNASLNTSRGEKHFKPPENPPFYVEKITTCNQKGEVILEIPRNEPLIISVKGKVFEPRNDYIIALDFTTIEDTLLFRSHSFEQKLSYDILNKRGDFTLECKIPPNLFPASTYRVGLITAIAGKGELQNYFPALEFDIIQTNLLGDRFLSTKGLLTPNCKWVKTDAN